jgi:hypothetical protein
VHYKHTIPNANSKSHPFFKRKAKIIGVVFVFWKVILKKLFSKLSCIYLSLEKLINEKHFTVKEKFNLVSRKVFSWKIWVENTFWKLWKI